MSIRVDAEDTVLRDYDHESQDGDAVVGKRKKTALEACHERYTVMVAIVVRLLLLAHAVMAVWVMLSLTKRTKLVACLAVSVLMLTEGLYTCIKRRGQESKWFCPCFLAYLCTVVPPIWLVELHRGTEFGQKLQNSTEELQSIQGLEVPIRLESNTWVSITEQTLLFLLVVCRWSLPRGDMTRQELSQLLFVFMGIASDNMTLFELFDETQVRKDRSLTYIILSVWSLSLLQFTFVLTSTKSLRKTRAVATAPSYVYTAGKRRRKKSVMERMFATEIWALTFGVLVQDGPYLGIRIYAVVKYNLITYSILFFICKNLLLISLVFYRLVILCFIQFSHSDGRARTKIQALSLFKSKSRDTWI